MNVLGLDLSLTATGIAFPDGSTAVLKPKTKGDHRYVEIADAVKAMALGVDLVIIEGPVTRSAAATVIGMVQGAVRSELLRNGVPYAVVTPGTLKKFAHGKGNATKSDMRMALYKRTGIDLHDDNEVDAWWLRAAGEQHLGEPSVVMPAAQVAALDKVAWPEGWPE